MTKLFKNPLFVFRELPENEEKREIVVNAFLRLAASDDLPFSQSIIDTFIANLNITDLTRVVGPAEHGVTVFGLLCRTPRGLDTLRAVCIHRREVVAAMNIALLGNSEDPGTSPLLRLCCEPIERTPSVVSLFYGCNPRMFNEMNIDMLRVASFEPTRLDLSLFWLLCWRADGLVILNSVFQAQPELMAQVTIGMLTTPRAHGTNKGISALWALLWNAEEIPAARSLLNRLFAPGSLLLAQITDEMLDVMPVHDVDYSVSRRVSVRDLLNAIDFDPGVLKSIPVARSVSASTAALSERC